MAIVAVLQVDPEFAAAIDRIATAQTIVAVATVLMLIAIAVLAIVGIRLLVLARRSLEGIDRSVSRLTPLAEPLLERSRRIVHDAGHAVTSVRDQVVIATDSLRRLNRALGEAVDSAEARGREFGAVLAVVQDQAQELLLDTTATAQGIRTIVDAFRGDVELATHRKATAEAKTEEGPQEEESRQRDEPAPESVADEAGTHGRAQEGPDATRRKVKHGQG